MEYWIRQGNLSPLLVRPVHPIHRHIANNLTFKLLTMAVVIPVVVVLTIVFRPNFTIHAWTALAFVPALLLAMALRFAVEWTLASVAFWVTRVNAINQLYFVVFLFLSGFAAPLDLLPEPVRVTRRAGSRSTGCSAFRSSCSWAGSAQPRLCVGFGAQLGWLALAASCVLNVTWARGVRASTRRSGREAMTYLRLLWIHLRLGILNELQYRTNLFIQLIQSTVGLVTALLGLGVVFSKTDSLGGWSAPELLAIVGVFTLVSGLTQLVVQPSLARFMEDVRLGTLDFTLTKPVDAQVLVSMRQIEVWKLVDVVVGFVVLGVAIAQLGATVGPAEAVAFVVALLAGVTIIYSFLLILATCASGSSDSTTSSTSFRACTKPGAGRSASTRPGCATILTFLVPIGFAITVPTEGLVGRLTSPNLLGALALAIALPLIARVLLEDRRPPLLRRLRVAALLQRKHHVTLSAARHPCPIARPVLEPSDSCPCRLRVTRKLPALDQVMSRGSSPSCSTTASTSGMTPPATQCITSALVASPRANSRMTRPLWKTRMRSQTPKRLLDLGRREEQRQSLPGQLVAQA